MTHTHYEFLSGIGLDVHAFSPKNNSKNQIILLCGIPISHFASIMAHSDGDVGLHAITDAILGAIGAGDIGEHFPPQDAKWKNKDSVHFVQ